MAIKNTGTAAAGSPLATIWSLHYLRAAAALGVVLFHCLGDAGFDFRLGSAGIHLFFTLSGFMMWSIAGNNDARPLPFMLGRVRRIVPMYWVATAVAVASTYVMPGFFYQATRHGPAILKSLLFIPQYGTEGGIYPVLYQGWTLQYEMYFYLLFTLCLFAPARSQLLLLSAIFMVLAAAGMIFRPQSPVLQTYTNPICLEFLAGVLVARLGFRISLPLAALGTTIGSTIAFCLCDSHEAALGHFAPFALAATASAMVVGLHSLEHQDRVPHDRILLLLGEASFAIYLFQDLGFALAVPFVGNAMPIARALVSALFAAVTGVVIHRMVEQPLTAWMKRLSRRPRPVCPQVTELQIAEP